MKKYSRIKMPVSIVVFGLVFGFSVLGLSAVKQAAAQGEEALLKTEEAISEPVEAKFKVEGVESDELEATDYYLPYPGILPDHPMYWLKMVRDRLQLLLISNPVVKTEKLLLYADKRLGAGWALVEGNKIQLGITTLTKAEKYLEKANFTLRQIKGEEELKVKLDKATRKHREVLLIVKDKVEDEYKPILEQMIKMSGEGEGYKLKDREVHNSKGVQEISLIIDNGETRFELTDAEAKTALELLKKGAEAENLEIKIKEYDFGSLVESIGDKKNTKQKAWIYYVNGKSGTTAADEYELKPGDVVEWKYIKPKF